MGSSRDMVIGPVAVVSLLLGTLVRNEFDPDTQTDKYFRLIFTATFFAGITQATLGFFRYLADNLFTSCYYNNKHTYLTMFSWIRLGFLIDFLSHAAVVGFMGGAAITIALQQLKAGFLGINAKQYFTKDTDIISVMKVVFKSAHHGVSSYFQQCMLSRMTAEA